MIIKSLKLTNFRGFADLNIDLHKKINVFAGVNGAGKSSVLQAISVMLAQLISKICTTKGTGRRFSEYDVRNGLQETNVSITTIFKGSEYNWYLSKSGKKIKSLSIQKDRPILPQLIQRSNLTHLKELTSIIQETLTKSDMANIPVAVYYSVNRSVIDIPLRIRSTPTYDQTVAYDNALTGKRNDFRLFFQWYRSREDYENERKRDSNSYIDSQLEAVRRAIESFTGFKELRVRRNPLRMEVTKDDKKYDIHQMSDGEKCHLALIGDLAKRLAIANPGLDNPLNGEGVVLIDEIDLHLHPIWQTVVIPKLMTIFPNCQFIVSTHSPHILTHVQPESVFLLKQSADGIKCDRAGESYGKNVDRILEDLMGLDTTRPEEVTKDLNTLFRLIDENKLNNAKTAYHELLNRIGNDPELVKADILIRRKEVAGK